MAKIKKSRSGYPSTIWKMSCYSEPQLLHKDLFCNEEAKRVLRPLQNKREDTSSGVRTSKLLRRYNRDLMMEKTRLFVMYCRAIDVGKN